MYGAIFLTSQELGLEVHLVEGVNGLIVVGLNLTYIWYQMLAICDLGEVLALASARSRFCWALANAPRTVCVERGGCGALETTHGRDSGIAW